MLDQRRIQSHFEGEGGMSARVCPVHCDSTRLGRGKGFQNPHALRVDSIISGYLEILTILTERKLIHDEIWA
jgi:hypothetical protein